MMKLGALTASSALMSTTLVNLINGQIPNRPNGSTATSPLLSVARSKFILDSKVMFLFSDDTNEEWIPDRCVVNGDVQ